MNQPSYKQEKAPENYDQLTNNDHDEESLNEFDLID
jgi:hypothetical protein